MDGQAGLCFNGFCECGVGFQGVGTNLDPTSCEFVCTPPAVADAVAFLNEPVVESYAESGELVLKVTIDPNLKQRPATIKMINPLSGVECGVLPDKLGLCELTQNVNPATCFTEYLWRHDSFDDVVQNSGCFEELPEVTESSPGFTVISRRFQTVYEVELKGLAPFGQNATRFGETLLTRTLRQEYTYVVATRVIMESDDFAVVADGLIRYRLVEIDVLPSSNSVRARVQTRVIAGGRVSPMRVNRTLTVGLPNILSDAKTQPCLASSPPNFCDQYHDLTFEMNPCASSGNLALQCGLQCDEDGIGNPVDCGFINVPIGNVYTLDNLLINYDACPVTTFIGIDSAKSFLRLHTDVARTTPVVAAVTLDSTIYGRLSLFPNDDSSFQSVTLNKLNLWNVGSPVNINLGNKLNGSNAFFALVSPPVSTDRLNPIFDFNVLVAFPEYSVDQAYYWEAVVDVVFLETGVLTKRRLNLRLDPADRLMALADRSDSEPSARQIVSNKFYMEASDRAELPPGSEEGGGAFPIVIVAVVVAGLVVGVAVLILALCCWRRRQKKSVLETTDLPALTLA
jgi:hypothetical protein